MKVKPLIMITLLMLLTNFLSGIEITYEGKVELTQKEGFYIGFSRGFVVTNEGLIIICDSRASDFKIFTSQGEPVKVFGRKGYGPDEFASPWLHDYQNGKLVISDTPTQKLYIYRVDENAKFNLKNQLMATSVLDAKLMDEKNRVLIASMPIREGPSAVYIVLTIDINNNGRTYLIPFELQLGENVKPVDFSKIGPGDFPDWLVLPAWKYCDYYGDNIYFIWAANLDIIKINLETKNHRRFSQKTDKYVKPKVSREYKKAYIEHNSEEYRNWNKSMSWVSKIFADSEVVGVIYSNFDKEISRWRSSLQIYDHQGNFLKEAPLENFSSTYERPDYYYDKANRILYCLSESSIGAEGFYTLYKYRLR